MKKAIVVHIINSSYDKEKKYNSVVESLKNVSSFSLENIKNPKFSGLSLDEKKSIINNLPAGTCICVTVFEKEESNLIICLPGFSSHISMPVKKGEFIWYFEDESFYEESDQNKDLHIKNYWFSRIHGLNISEDPTFTFHERDYSKDFKKEKKPDGVEEKPKARSVKNNKEQKKKVKNSLTIPKFDLDYTKSSSKNINYLPSNIIDSSSLLNPYPKYYSSNNSLTLTGSGNSLINIESDISKSSKKGGVDIVAGRLAESDNILMTDAVESLEFSILTGGFKELIDTGKKKKFKYIKRYPNYVIKNNLNFNETLKDPSNYLFNESDLEFNHNIEKDVNSLLASSRLYICERDSIDASFDLNKYIKYQNNASNETIDKEVALEFIKNKKINKNQNAKYEKFDIYSSMYPSILQKSSVIRIVARESYEKTELDKSSIRLIKESKDYKKYSHICLEENGNILLDGNKILIGNFKRQAFNSEKITEADIESIANKTKKEDDFSSAFDELSGKGDLIILGHSEKHSEPLVLGNSLVNVLNEIIEVNISLMDQLNSTLSLFDSHVHMTAAPGSPTATTISITQANQNNINLIKSDLVNISNSLNKLLSKVAKTS